MPYSDALFETSRTSKEQSLAEHGRLASLFINDRFAFEIERKRRIRELLEMVPCPEMRARLQDLQNELDRVLKGAGSGHNRLVMMQMFFWERINNVFIPALNELSRRSARSGGKKIKSSQTDIELSEASNRLSTPRLRLLKTHKG